MELDTEPFLRRCLTPPRSVTSRPVSRDPCEVPDEVLTSCSPSHGGRVHELRGRCRANPLIVGSFPLLYSVLSCSQTLTLDSPSRRREKFAEKKKSSRKESTTDEASPFPPTEQLLVRIWHLWKLRCSCWTTASSQSTATTRVSPSRSSPSHLPSLTTSTSCSYSASSSGGRGPHHL